MDKKTYYIRVGSGEILEDPEAAEFEYEIKATDAEIDKLSALFEQRADTDDASFFRAGTPYKEYHKDNPNVEYDEYLKEIYQMIHDLGDQKNETAHRTDEYTITPQSDADFTAFFYTLFQRRRKKKPGGRMNGLSGWIYEQDQLTCSLESFFSYQQSSTLPDITRDSRYSTCSDENWPFHSRESSLHSLITVNNSDQAT